MIYRAMVNIEMIHLTCFVKYRIFFTKESHFSIIEIVALMRQSPRSSGKKAQALEPSGYARYRSLEISLCEIQHREPRWYHEKTRPCIADMLYSDEFFYLLI